MDYDLQGERRGGRVCVPRGPEGGRDRASRSGRDALAEPEKGRPKGKAEAGLLAIEDRASRPADPRGAPRAPGPGQPKSLDRTQDSLTEAEKRELKESSRYSYPVRRGPSQPRVLADWEYESFGLERAMAAIELVEPAQ